MKPAGFEKVNGTECLYRYRPNGKYYARFVINGKEVRRSLGTSDCALAKRRCLRWKGRPNQINPPAKRLTSAGRCNENRPTFNLHRAKLGGRKDNILNPI